jgi:hypothetical protein
VSQNAIFNEVLAHFLTAFAEQQAPRRLELYVSDFLAATYSQGTIDDFVAQRLGDIRDSLIREYNERVDQNDSLRFSFADDDGDVVQGIGGLAKTELLAFQDGLNSLTSAEFETFSAHILRVATCTRVWYTQETHDEGLDAFGYMPFFRIRKEWLGGRPEVVFLAQAKHYSDCKVGSRDIRELVGSSELAKHKVYSKLDERYNDLSIPPFAPLALVFITTQEIPRTVKNMSRLAGIVVLASDDLFSLFTASVDRLPTPLTSQWIAMELRHLCENIPKAK